MSNRETIEEIVYSTIGIVGLFICIILVCFL
jgi:hypothetical protein